MEIIGGYNVKQQGGLEKKFECCDNLCYYTSTRVGQGREFSDIIEVVSTFGDRSR